MSGARALIQVDRVVILMHLIKAGQGLIRRGHIREGLTKEGPVLIRVDHPLMGSRLTL
jgi:hypothetical protein